jgi:glycosyltransferase involved in cell wall biosynthesis
MQDPPASVLVSHPHVAAVALGLAGALAEQGKLGAFVTGVAFREGSIIGQAAAALAHRWPVLRNRILLGPAAASLRAQPIAELGARLTARALARLVARPPLSLYDAIFATHDLAAARAVWPPGTTAIYAYEDGARRTFERAAREGIARIWDLPTPHHRTAEQVFRDEESRWPGAASGPPHQEPAWKLRRKNAELELATQISVASAFTKQSLEHLERRAPVLVTPYGFPVESFAARTTLPEGRFRVLSVGMHDLRKGTPYLLEAWRRAALPDAELTLVGPLRFSKSFLDRYAGLFTHVLHVPRRELGAYYRRVDLLVFPTLGDGFGLVIQEAMSSGTPVLTTPCGGGPECITDGVEGWIVPPRDIDALVARLREAAADRDRLAHLGAQARARAERWTWRDAGAALVKNLGL